MSLTNEDKQWIIEQLAQQLAQLPTKEWTLARLERVETSLLTEFHKWASPVEMRAKSHSAAIRALDVELEAVASRVDALERPHQ